MIPAGGWTNQQARAIDAAADWFKRRDKPYFIIFGLAGTGKTTMARHLADTLVGGQAAFLAYTGKAASQLRKAGAPNPTTIHSACYKVVGRSMDAYHELVAIIAKMKADHAIPSIIKDAEDELRQMERRLRDPKFALNDENNPIRQMKLLVVDEASMVTDQMAEDLMSFNVPIMVLGDPGQLPPVRGGDGFFARQAPDVMLTDIQRQALDNPILRYALLARNGETIPYVDAGLFRKVPRAKVTDAMLVKAAAAGTQLLMGKNKTRREANALVRTHLGRLSPYPVKDDRLVCLKNNYTLGIMNGEVVDSVQDAEQDGDLFVTIRHEDKVHVNVPVSAEPFDAAYEQRDAAPIDFEGPTPFDFGYGLTVHKSQGSQWPRVVLVDDGFAKKDPELRRKWLYTAITRAAERMTIVA